MIADAPAAVSIVSVLQPFAVLLTRPTWTHARVLSVGTLLARGPRTVTAALRLGQEQRRFERYHRVPNRARRSSPRGARIVLELLFRTLPPQ